MIGWGFVKFRILIRRKVLKVYGKRIFLRFLVLLVCVVFFVVVFYVRKNFNRENFYTGNE